MFERLALFSDALWGTLIIAVACSALGVLAENIYSYRPGSRTMVFEKGSRKAPACSPCHPAPGRLLQDHRRFEAAEAEGVGEQVGDLLVASSRLDDVQIACRVQIAKVGGADEREPLATC